MKDKDTEQHRQNSEFDLFADVDLEDLDDYSEYEEYMRELKMEEEMELKEDDEYDEYIDDDFWGRPQPQEYDDPFYQGVRPDVELILRKMEEILNREGYQIVDGSDYRIKRRKKERYDLEDDWEDYWWK